MFILSHHVYPHHINWCYMLKADTKKKQDFLGLHSALWTHHCPVKGGSWFLSRPQMIKWDMCSEILREEWQWWKGAVCICIHHKPITGLISLPLSRRINLQGQRGVSWWLKPQQEEAGWAVPCLATQPCLHRSWSCLTDTQKGLHSIWLQHLRGNTWTEWPEHITNTWRPGHVCRWPMNRFTLDSVQSL